MSIFYIASDAGNAEFMQVRWSPDEFSLHGQDLHSVLQAHASLLYTQVISAPS